MGADNSKALTDEQLETLLKNTKFTTEELQGWHEKFMVEHPTGSIDKEDFLKMYGQMFPKGEARQFAEHVFRAYDIDGNGVIDFNEFMGTLSVSARGTLREKLDWTFRMYDADNDGAVSMAEVTEMLLSIHRMKGYTDKQAANEMAERIFGNLDKNRDDKISSEEFYEGIKSCAVLVDMLRPQ